MPLPSVPELPLHMRILVAASLALLQSARVAPAQTTSPRLGTIDFPTSGSAAAQPFFVRGILYLHSFEYDSAAKSFREAQRIDPRFAMAYWGEAMTYTHPVWNQQDVAAARTALSHLAASPEERRAAAATERERRWLDAVELLYGVGSKAKRDTLFAAAMERLAADFPGDREAQAFHALALLGLNQGVRDVPTYMRAAAISQEILRANPDHPGAAHYVIHAYDDPPHATLGLPAARSYSKIAPSAGHAQHMTSHIFIALGMWDDVIQANEVALAQTQNRSGHYGSWLAYAYLQQGRVSKALDVLRRMREASAGQGVPAAAQMFAALVIDGEAARPPVAGIASDSAAMPAAARAWVLYANAYAALAPGRTTLAADRVRALAANGLQGRETGELSGAALTIADYEIRALAEYRSANLDAALQLLRDAAALDEGHPYEFGPPLPAKPPRELLGELLLREHRPSDAKREFELALARAPGRLHSLLGLARASSAAGDSAAAERAYSELRRNLTNADADFPLLEEIRGSGRGKAR